MGLFMAAVVMAMFAGMLISVPAGAFMSACVGALQVRSRGGALTARLAHPPAAFALFYALFFSAFVALVRWKVPGAHLFDTSHGATEFVFWLLVHAGVWLLALAPGFALGWQLGSAWTQRLRGGVRVRAARRHP
ncbi:hypothetical protein [Piscinibacterium candidicorallinum]|uniref:Uncharacterized protein n=1 Tax=Piscinibacterium candidicorallinum TaxID=1793872 RepID=A0ABV7H6T4_9BURK